MKLSLTNPKGAGGEARNKGIAAARRERKREGAQARQHVTALMHPQARLALLDNRPGNSTRERARLTAQIEKG